MTNLTFAIEAAKRGCEFVTTEEDRKTVNFYRGDECHFKCIVNKCDRYERFIIGATLALWWDNLADQMDKDYSTGLGEIHKVRTLAKQARSFAKGL